jgi:hypothetical protein
MENDAERPRRRGQSGTVQIVLHVFGGALGSLSPRDRELLVEEYGLEASAPDSGPRRDRLVSPSLDAAARQMAVAHARRRLARAIESSLDEGTLHEIHQLSMSPLELVERELARTHEVPERLDVRDLRGTGGIRPDYDYKALRTESA